MHRQRRHGRKGSHKHQHERRLWRSLLLRGKRESPARTKEKSKEMPIKPRRSGPGITKHQDRRARLGEAGRAELVLSIRTRPWPAPGRQTMADDGNTHLKPAASRRRRRGLKHWRQNASGAIRVYSVCIASSRPPQSDALFLPGTRRARRQICPCPASVARAIRASQGSSGGNCVASASAPSSR